MWVQRVCWTRQKKLLFIFRFNLFFQTPCHQFYWKEPVIYAAGPTFRDLKSSASVKTRNAANMKNLRTDVNRFSCYLCLIYYYRSKMVLLVGPQSPGSSLYRCSTVIAIGCPGIVWSRRTFGLLCQRTTAHELCSVGKTFFELIFFTV